MVQEVSDIVAIKVAIEGRVQEGGLKATVRALAREHSVACESTLDTEGKMGLLAEGERKAVNSFVAALRKAASGVATSFNVWWTAPSRKEEVQNPFHAPGS